MSQRAYGKQQAPHPAASVKRLNDKWRLVPSYLKVRGLVRQHIDSFDNFLRVEMQKIVIANREVKSTADGKTVISYNDIRVGLPNAEMGYEQIREIVPNQCRLQDMTYSAPVYVDIMYRKGQVMAPKSNVCIGRIPIMLKSCRCILRGKSEKELAQLKECPLDPGGYFIVKGQEKVVLIHEQLSKNRVIVEVDGKGYISSTVMSSTHERKSRCSVILKNGRLYMKQNTLGDEVSIIILLKALGVESDAEIVSLIAGADHRIGSLLTASFQEAHEMDIFSSSQANVYIGQRIKSLKARSARRRWSRDRPPEDESREVLATVVLPHIPSPSYNFRQKAVYVAYMARMALTAKLDKHRLDDKDYYGNKRLELAGQLISLLFEDLFKRFNTEIQRQADAVLTKVNRAAEFDTLKLIRQDTITNGFVQMISTGNWSLKRFRMDRQGVTQQLSRLSYMSCLGHMSRVTSQFEKTRKVSGPRSLQSSQWGMLCPSDTPEGESCGLVKNLALLTHVTADEEESCVADLCYALGVVDACELSGEELYGDENYIVFLNGRILGAHRYPVKFQSDLKILRRARKFGKYISIHLHSLHRCIYIASDAGRVCRPLIIVENGKPKLESKHLKQIQDPTDPAEFWELVNLGLVEFIDVNEENNCLVALDERYVTDGHTHMEIDPMTILGTVAGLIPFPHHNQSPRNTYQCARGKQAIGTIGYNQMNRLDTLLYLMTYPMKPLVTTRVLDLVSFNKLPAGQNAIIAVMSYSGYDIEDALVLNKSSVERGYGRCMVMKKFATTVRRYANNTRDRVREMAEGDGAWSGKHPSFFNKLGAIEEDGICGVGCKVSPSVVLVRKETPKNTIDGGIPVNGTAEPDIEYQAADLVYKAPVGMEGVVDKVLITSNQDETTIIKCLIRQMRTPELGDKFSSRHGQKGVCGIIVPQEDLPFSDRGLYPDMIMNPHGFPSRMTVAKMIELLASKASVLCGERMYGTAFGEDPDGNDHSGAVSVDYCSSILINNGYNYAGKDLLYSGITGEPMNAYIFMGPVYYQKLKHMVLDKMHARPRGPRAVLTRQPTEGRARDGGLRLGEMERDCLIGYGASSLLLERLMVSSDVYDATVCQSCGLLAYPGKCNYCENVGVDYELTTLKLPYAAKLLFQELQAMNIVPKVSMTNC
jgi:DNA-directed RNA polymerase III subunit RPC2